jgi:hypothetical protein
MLQSLIKFFLNQSMKNKYFALATWISMKTTSAQRFGTTAYLKRYIAKNITFKYNSVN